MKNSRVVNLREVMITVILSILCSFLYLGWGPVYGVVNGLIPSGGEVVYGMWFIAAVLAAYIVQKPGVALLAEMAAAAGEALLGGHWGMQTLVYGFAQGIAVELIFALFVYRNFHVTVLMLAGAMAAVGSFVVQWVVGDLAELTSGVLTSMIIIRLLSGAILGGLLAKLIVDLLVPTGVLNAYALVRNKMEKPF
jgi:energy-coupling factor transport system substrate-specific component